MPWITVEHQNLVADILDEATMIRSICPCKERISAIIKTSEVVTERCDGIFVFADILEPKGFPCDNILRPMGVPPQCGHDGISGIHMLVNKGDISRAVSKEKLLVFNAKVSFASQSPFLDVRGLESGMIDFMNRESSIDINCAEFFCGGFSGWTHAIDAMKCGLLPLRHTWALDNDYLAVQTYVRSHQNTAHINCSSQAWELQRFEQITGEKSCMVFQANICDAWFMNHIPNEELHVLALSPPCQPWSMAHTSLGLNRSDGKIFVHAMAKASCIRPKIILLEEVAQFGKHDQFPIVCKLFDWSEYQIVDQKILNLNKLLPQNRSRFLLVALDKHASDVARFIEWADWPIPTAVTIRKSRVVLPIDRIDLNEVVPSPSVMNMYMDPTLLPMNEYSAATFAGTGTQVRKIRIKVLDDHAFGCIMANYRKAHDLPKSVLGHGGLYGTFLYHENIIRFLSIEEIFLLMGPTKRCRLPSCHHAQTHLLGNCIAVPHAASAIINGLRCLSGVTLPSEPENIFAHVFSKRITIDNLGIQVDEHGIHLYDNGEIDFLDEPTMDFPSLAPLIISTPIFKSDLMIENGVVLKQAIEIVAGPSTPKELVIQSGEGLRVPLLDSDVMGRTPTTIVANLPSIMSLQESKFMSTSYDCCLVLTRNGPVIVQRHHDMTIKHVLKFLGEFLPETVSCNATLCNQFGIRHTEDMICPDIVMCHNPITVGVDETLNSQLPCFHHELDHLCIKCDWAHAFKILKFYQGTGLNEVLKCLGWSIQIIPEVDGKNHHVHVTIARLPSKLSMTLNQVRMCIDTRLLILSFPTSLDDDYHNVFVQFKLWDTYVWKGFCKSDDSIAVFIDAWERFSQQHGSHSCLRVIYKGKPIMPHVTFGELQTDDKLPVKLHAVLQLHGGGNKQDALTEVKHALAIFLMGQGAVLKDISNMLEILARTAGLQALKSISEIHVTKDKLAALHQLAVSMNVQWPESVKGDANKTDRVKNWSKKRALSSSPIVANQLSLIPETFVNEDGSHPSIRTTVVTGASGVVLLDFECAKPWLIDQKVITSDEIAIAVLGHLCPCNDPSRCHSVNLPVHSIDGTLVIVKACFHNLGEKRIAIKPCNKDQVDVKAGTVAAITIFRDEISPGEWAHVINGPVRYALASFDLSDEAVFQGPPWGRSWLQNGSKSSPENASSLQFHVRVDPKKLEGMMKSSGSNGTYITPKADNNLADTRFAIVWVDGNPIDIAQMMLKTPEHFGQVRVNKGKGDNVKISRGVRCKRDHFANVFAKLRPNESAPDITPVDCLYKIQPTPVGAQMKDVQAWMKLQGWDGRPLKLLGDKCWLIGSAKPFDHPFLSWNSSSILIKKVQSKHAVNPSPIVAGKVSLSLHKQGEQQNRGATDPFLTSDPWMNYAPSSVANSRPFLKQVASVAAPRDVDPPTESRFKQQGEQISALETAMTELQSKIDQRDHQSKKFEQDVKDEFRKVRTEVSSQIDNVSKSFDQSLDRALRKQEASIEHSFSELKQLIRMSQGPLPNKKAKASKAADEKDDIED